MYINWDSSFETGQPLVDTEHRMLIFLFRKLDMAVKSGESQMTVYQIVEELKRFVEFHFASEENLMRETNYPHSLTHREQHSILLSKLSGLLSKLVDHSDFPEDLVSFLNNWLVDHIANHDQHVALHIRDASSRPIAESAYGEFMAIDGEAPHSRGALYLANDRQK